MSDVKLQLKARGARPQFFEDPINDRLVAIITALAGEVSVLHDQVDTLSRILDQKGLISSSETAGFVPDMTVNEQRDEWRETFLDNVFRIIHQEQEGLEEGGQTDEDYANVVSAVRST